ncbi:hypothetical protein AMATHDRAFT_64144 [Amanita thiersii Skay4041]|uniref:Transcriptional repressor Tup1 N-terminal domain-containing protein n=1 Tax=Amanita thiersii Skay4041 TaxID=703135 RepID=A0A2A9NMK3_9AGAR|nr:hypothetical protein AMATHDRAFT_64144 [Amanita thiersii Skay4041]
MATGQGSGYNHRAPQPAAMRPQVIPSTHGPTRLQDAFDIIQRQMDSRNAEMENLRAERDAYEAQVRSQTHELAVLRRSLHELETLHKELVQDYEKKLGRLREQLKDLNSNNTGNTTNVTNPGVPQGSALSPSDSRRDLARIAPAPAPLPPEPVTTTPRGISPSAGHNRVVTASTTSTERSGAPPHTTTTSTATRRVIDAERVSERLADNRATKRRRSRADHYQSQSSSSSPSSHQQPNPIHQSRLPPPPHHQHYQSQMGRRRQLPRHYHHWHPSESPPLPPLEPQPGIRPLAFDPELGEPTYLADLSPEQEDRIATMLKFLPPKRRRAQSPRPHVTTSHIDRVPDDEDEMGGRKVMEEWTVKYNPDVPKKLEIKPKFTILHTSVCCCVQISPDGKYLAAGYNRAARLYDIKTGDYRGRLVHDDDVPIEYNTMYVRTLRFSPDGKYLATGSEDCRIRLWDLETQEICRSYSGHTEEIYAIEYSQDGKLLVSGSGDSTARIWDLETFEPPKVLRTWHTIESRGTHGFLTDTHPRETDPDGVTSLALTASADLLAVGYLDCVVRLWDVQTGVLLARLAGHTEGIYSVAFSADSQGVFSGGLDTALRYWDVSAVYRRMAESRRALHDHGVMTSSGVAAAVAAAQFEMPLPQKADEATAAAVAAKGERTGVFGKHDDYILSIAPLPDSTLVLSGSKDRHVNFWDAKTATLQMSLLGHKNTVISMALHSSRGLLATGGGDGFARIWEYKPIEEGTST